MKLSPQAKQSTPLTENEKGEGSLVSILSGRTSSTLVPFITEPLPSASCPGETTSVVPYASSAVQQSSDEKRIVELRLYKSFRFLRPLPQNPDETSRTPMDSSSPELELVEVQVRLDCNFARKGSSGRMRLSVVLHAMLLRVSNVIQPP